MISVRRSDDRGTTDAGWLHSRHTFSFGDYLDPDHHHFRTLRVINDDLVAPARGFGTHFHRDMEIVSYVLSGELEHRDSLGNGSIIRAGDVQRMTAGTGVEHSEFNPSRTDAVRFLQMWIVPERRGLAPGYEQRSFPPGDRRGRLRVVASRTGRDGSVVIHQDAEILLAALGAASRVVHPVRSGRAAWVQVATGRVRLTAAGDRIHLATGDGASLDAPGDLEIAAEDGDAEVVVFDVA